MKTLPIELKEHLLKGTIIPAHPLALNENRTLDEKAQRRLSRYYIASGAGGIAVGVHSTQFEIRDPKVGLFKRVLDIAIQEVKSNNINRKFITVAGICGPVDQAVSEAKIASTLGYDIGLLSMGGLENWSEKDILERVRRVADHIPVFGFYLQPSVGGRIFSYDFWREFVEIPGVEAIKCASFNRYQTLDVMRALANSSRREEVAMYTGNDDNIVADLLTDYVFTVGGKSVEVAFRGGLLGHWAIWTNKVVALFEEIKAAKQARDGDALHALLAKGVQITDVNAALFDPSNGFKGCIPGIHEVLRRQGLLQGIWCLNPHETLSEGQLEEINRIYKDYPALNDDAFVAEFLQRD